MDVWEVMTAAVRKLGYETRVEQLAVVEAFIGGQDVF